MRTRRDRNLDLLGEALIAANSEGAARLFSSKRTLFGIPSALDEELEALAHTQAAPEEPSRNDDTRTHVEHCIDPVFNEDSHVLILGTMPSPKSRETGFYYNHPQNRFWKVMAALFNESIPETNDEKRALALRHGIALWDVLAACDIQGARDATIANCIPNDIAWLLSQTPIEAIFCTGAKAHALYESLCLPKTNIPATRLPSTSPANAQTSLAALIEVYRAILPYCY